MSETTCGKEIEGCFYYDKPIICGKTIIQGKLQQCTECWVKDGGKLP